MDIKNPFNNTIDEKNIFNYTNTNIEKNDDMYDFSLINNDYMQQHNKKNSQYLDKANDKKMFCIIVYNANRVKLGKINNDN
jgi:hypothetical protein